MKKIIKQTLISILFLGFLNLSFYFLKILLFEKGGNLNSLIFFLVSIFFTSTFFIFLVSTIRRLKWQILILILASGSIFLWFDLNIFLAPGTFLFFLFLLFAGKTIEDEKKILLKFSFPRISKKGFGTLFTGFAILIAILLFLSPKIMKGEFSLPKSLFDAVWPIIENILFSQYPGFSGNLTVDQFLILQRSEALKKLLEEYPEEKPSEGLPEISLLPFGKGKIEIELKVKLKKEMQKKLEEERKKVSKKLLSEMREQFAKSLGIEREIKGNEKVKDIFYEAAANQISKTIQPWENAGKAGLIFVFFILIRTVLIFLTWIFLPFAWALFKIFKATKFFEIKKIQVEKEEIAI